jgi:hypothetical protein
MNGNPFYIRPAAAGLGQAVAPVAQAMVQRGQRQEQEAKLAAQKKLYGGYMDAIDSGDFEAQREIERANPVLMEQLGKISAGRKSQIGGIEGSIANDYLLGGMTGEELANKWEPQLQSFGQGRMAEWLRTASPEQLRGVAIQNLDKDSYQRYRDSLPAGASSNIGTVSPKDFTVESMAEYEKTGDIKSLVRYRPKTIKIANVEHAYNNETMKYEPIVDMRSEGFTEQERAAAESEADRQAVIDFGKEKSKWQTDQPKYLNNISAAEQKHTVVSNTANKIKDLMSGWTNKYGSSLSSLPGTDARTLRGLIDTMKANSAFSTLTDLKASGGTLGAISGPELNLLERAWGALDQGGDATEFVRVLDQLVDQNTGSLVRTRNAYDMDKERYSGSYDDAQRKIEAENTVSWEDL